MKVNKNIWVGKNKPYNQNSWYFPNGINSGSTPPSGGESNIEYLDVSADTLIGISLGTCALYAKMMKNGNVVVGPGDMMRTLLTADGNQGGVTTLAVAIDFTSIVKARMGEEYIDTSLMQFLGMFDWTKEFLDSIPRITKEQFYTLD